MLKRTQLESRPLGHAKIKKPPSKAWGLFYFDAMRIYRLVSDAIVCKKDSDVNRSLLYF